MAAAACIATMLTSACVETAPATLPAVTPELIPPSRATPSPSLNGALAIALQDIATSTQCPSGTPISAMCYLLNAQGGSSQLGDVSVDSMLDVEFNAPPLCGRKHTFEETLATSEGRLTVRVTAPYLCPYATGTTQRTYSILSGTGKLVGASGSGQVSFDALSDGASETWRGSLVVPPS